MTNTLMSAKHTMHTMRSESAALLTQTAVTQRLVAVDVDVDA